MLRQLDDENNYDDDDRPDFQVTFIVVTSKWHRNTFSPIDTSAIFQLLTSHNGKQTQLELF